MTPRALHLMRHGAPLRRGLMLGHTDDPPSDDGRAACRQRAKGLAVARVITSDLARARLAAGDIARDLGLFPLIDVRWRELDFGAWEARDPQSLGDDLVRFWADPDHHPPPGGERWSQITARVGAALAELQGDTLVVSHAGAIRAALGVLLRLDHTQVWAFDLPYGALISLRVWPDGAQVTGLAT